MELTSSRRWLCTGTPINNSIDDLLGQFAGVCVAPLNNKKYFDSHIKVRRQ